MKPRTSMRDNACMQPRADSLQAVKGGSAVARCDVFVIGGGPAGTTIAALLAQRGWDVVLAEKDRHPRFHIGESLLPMNVPLFERLGVKERIEGIAMFKYAAELNSPQHDAPVNFAFDQAWDKGFPYAYQVRRSEFDRILFENCVAQGVRALQDCRVTTVELPAEGGAQIATAPRDAAPGRWRARFLVDASGRDTFLASKLGMKRRNPQHNSAALYGHFTGARRLPGKQEGNISMFWFEHGWFWFIPLRDGTTSVGAVCWPYYMKSRKSDPTAFFLETIALCPRLRERLRDARLVAPATATGNYSYECARMVGNSHILIGDAFAFVDPVFSSGVFLAMNSAFLGADAVDASLRGAPEAAALKRRFERQVRHGLLQFSWFIYRMTSPAMRSLFMAPRNTLRMQEALLGLLAGDLFRGTPIYRGLAAFKGVYYLTSLLRFRHSLAAWRRRRCLLTAEVDDRPPSV
jgi:flavin-dependent dehydrogenase